MQQYFQQQQQQQQQAMAAVSGLGGAGLMGLMGQQGLSGAGMQFGGANNTFLDASNILALQQQLQQQQANPAYMMPPSGANNSFLQGNAVNPTAAVTNVTNSELQQDPYAEYGILGPWSATSAGLFGKMATSANSAGKAAKKLRKKPKDRPKRPLSAYNIFFKEERARILKEIPAAKDGEESKEESKDDPEDEKDNGESPRKRKKRPHGKIGFESLAKTIGRRWQELDKDEASYYKKKAGEDMKRYKLEMEVYLFKQRGGDKDAPKAGEDKEAPIAGGDKKEASEEVATADEEPAAKKIKVDEA